MYTNSYSMQISFEIVQTITFPQHPTSFGEFLWCVRTISPINIANQSTGSRILLRCKSSACALNVRTGNVPKTTTFNEIQYFFGRTVTMEFMQTQHSSSEIGTSSGWHNASDERKCWACVRSLSVGWQFLKQNHIDLICWRWEQTANVMLLILLIGNDNSYPNRRLATEEKKNQADDFCWV